MIPKMSPLLLREVLVFFFNVLTADGKYPVQDCENLNVHQILKILRKRTILIVNVFQKLETFKILVRSLFKKRSFRTPFYCQHVKVP